jgi:hypothetical protein|tara:strand:+ start:792 stop:1139 length:348 start_codon:yes stop_codon:yes gene_type:complete
MLKVFVAISLFLNIGTKNHIHNTFCEQNAVHIKSHIGNNVIFQLQNQNILFGTRRSIEWFDALAKDPRIINTRVKKLKKHEFTYSVEFKFKDQGQVFTQVIFIEVYKGRILRVLG